MSKTSTCLWFDANAEQAVDFYLSVFTDAKRLRISRYPDVPQEERPPSWPAVGSVMCVEFEMLGQHYIALNGGSLFQFSESISLVVNCDTQDEIDRYWAALTADGGTPVQCGWLRDRFGLSWQVVPRVLGDFMTSDDPALVARVTRAMLKMVKLDIAELQAAAHAPNELVSSRFFPHARQRVFEAFSDPHQLTLWFGPNGFTSTFEKFDFRIGGEWVFTFHGPNGTDYPNQSTFVEIVPNERIVYDHTCMPHFRMTMTLAEENNGTRLTWRMAFETVQLCETLKGICVPANEENFDRLAAHLASI